MPLLRSWGFHVGCLLQTCRSYGAGVPLRQIVERATDMALLPELFLLRWGILLQTSGSYGAIIAP
jgi:hypothetical protein